MQPPVVQSLDQILAQLDPAYAPQKALFQQQSSLLPGQQTAAIGGLDTAKGNAFRDINTNSNSKGLAFSGIPAAEQTRYVGEKYLPARANLESDFQKQGFTLAQSIAQLDAEKRLKGIDTQAGQQKTLDSYLEAERNRQFEAEQTRVKIQADAAQAAANRAAQAAAAKSQGAPTGLVDSISKLLDSKKGGDSFVSPETFRAAMSKWITGGGSPDSFLQTYSAYVNPVHQERFGGYF